MLRILFIQRQWCTSGNKVSGIHSLTFLIAPGKGVLHLAPDGLDGSKGPGEIGRVAQR